MLSVLDTANQGHDAGAGKPTQNSTGTASAAEASIWAVIARGGLALDLTAAFQAACNAALIRAATTSVLSTQVNSR
jgi:hypothetical protein